MTENKKLSQLFGIDLRSLALFRIGLGAVVLGDVLNRLPNLRAFYTDAGVLPRSLLLEKSASYPLSIHLLSGSAPLQAFLFFMTALGAVALIFGYRSRLAAFLCWILLASLNARNPLIHQEGDILLRLYLFLGLFLPLGSCASIVRSLDASIPKLPQRIFSGGTLALLLQTCFVYWFTVLNRTGTTWREGSALYYAFHINSITASGGAFLLHYPRFLEFLTHFTFCLEALGPILAFAPFLTGTFRTLVVFLFVGLHLGMAFCLNLGLFPYISIVGWLPFLPSEFWEKVLGHGPTSRSFAEQGKKVCWPANLLPLLFLANALLWNLSTVNERKLRLPLPVKLKSLSRSLSFAQGWGMFGPDPQIETGWYVIPGRLRDGSEVDIFREGKPLDWEKPSSPSALALNVRWRKYFDWITFPWNADYRPYYGRYLCREWNRHHPSDQALGILQIDWMREKILPQDQNTEPEKILLWKGDCSTNPDSESAPASLLPPAAK